jgi:hypothetical protein
MLENNIYNLGFPKCGTSSIWQFFAEFPPTRSRCLHTEHGEIDFNLIRDMQDTHRMMLSGGGCFLKDPGAGLETALESYHQTALFFGEPIYLLSVRSPSKVLPSWFSMHKAMAKAGTYKDHIAVKQRDKYLAMTIDDYAEIYLEKTNYAKHIEKFLDLVAGSQVWILDFRRVKHGTKGVMGNFLDVVFPGIDYPNEFPRRNVGKYSTESIQLQGIIAETCSTYERELDALLARIRLNNTNVALGHSLDRQDVTRLKHP